MCIYCWDLYNCKRDRTGKISFPKSDIDCVIVRKFNTLLQHKISDFHTWTCAH